jgi:hypothetical protein
VTLNKLAPSANRSYMRVPFLRIPLRGNPADGPPDFEPLNRHYPRQSIKPVPTFGDLIEAACSADARPVPIRGPTWTSAEQEDGRAIYPPLAWLLERQGERSSRP